MRYPRFTVLVVVSGLSLACTSDSGSRSETPSGLPATFDELVEGCRPLCEASGRCSGEEVSSFCAEECGSNPNFSIDRSDFALYTLDCETQQICLPEEQRIDCNRVAIESLEPTPAGESFCAEHGTRFDFCLPNGGYWRDCREWARQVSDPSLLRFELCLQYPTCSELDDCFRLVFEGSIPEPYDAANACDWARDGRCDEPLRCDAGTDSADCSIPDARENSCILSFNSQCNAADCLAGTDTEDCTVQDPGNTCVTARNGFCDEPPICAMGTDSDDCGDLT